MSDRRFADESRNVLADQDEMHARVRQARDEAMFPFHSPTPWRIATETGPCVITNGTREIAECYEDGEVQTTEDEANAAHIVKAVNLHDELVTALRYVVKFADSEPDGGETVAMHRANIERARSVLAKVTA
jgi:hypothetical protein